MRQFGTNDILTGYIKQLLAAFNLPTVRVYTKEHEDYFLANFTEREDILRSSLLDAGAADGIRNVCHVLYIKDGKLQRLLEDGWHAVGSTSSNPHHVLYNRGDKLLNLTKNFKIKNNNYDYYTHEYLGDYLRFIRDYDNIDLMPLYNCFSNRMCNNLNCSFVPTKVRKTLTRGSYTTSSLSEVSSFTVNFNSEDSDYKIYMLPVKLFKKYTIAIDSSRPIEMFCGIYGAGFDDSATYAELRERTYFKQGISQFNKPFIFDKLYNLMKSADSSDEQVILQQLLLQVAQRESELKLFIKIPSSAQSSITILEGDYTSWNDNTVMAVTNMVDEVPKTTWCKKKNHTIISNELLLGGADIDLITPLQLLTINTGTHLPFADRLIEYLLGNCITGGPDELRGNLVIAQRLVRMYYRNANKYADKFFRYKPIVYKHDDVLEGTWSDNLRKIFYNYMNNITDQQANHDILGYVDKDVEKHFFVLDNTGKKKSMLNVNLWEEEED